MSHELRTPLNSILGFSQILLGDKAHPLIDSQKLFLGKVLKAGDHLLKLINEVLDLAKVESGTIELELDSVEPPRLVADSLEMITLAAADRGIAVVNSVDKSGDWPLVKTDFTRAKQCMVNLLSNAVKYNRDGGKVIVEAAITNDEFLQISVTDTGPGIAASQMEDVFKPFKRLTAKGSGIEGSGLGLPLTKQLAEQLSGNLGVDSTPGEGSRFWVKLPLAQD